VPEVFGGCILLFIISSYVSVCDREIGIDAVAAVVSVIIREVHRADVPGNPHYIASVQLVDEEDGWVSPAFPVDYHTVDELKRKILHEVQLYLDARATYGKAVARAGT
jgi:hypothetical protein